jgi:hypothetical protein
MAFARAVSGAGCRLPVGCWGLVRPSTVDWQLVGENQVACTEPIFGLDAQPCTPLSGDLNIVARFRDISFEFSWRKLPQPLQVDARNKQTRHLRPHSNAMTRPARHFQKQS